MMRKNKIQKKKMRTDVSGNVMYLKEKKMHKNAHYDSQVRELKETRSFIEEVRLKISSEYSSAFIRN